MAREAAVVPPQGTADKHIARINDLLGPGGGRPKSGYSIKEELDDLRRQVEELRGELTAIHTKHDALLARLEGHTHVDLETWISKVRADLQAEAENLIGALNAHFHPEIVNLERAVAPSLGRVEEVPPDDQEQQS